MPNGKLTAKQSTFVDEYLVDLNATQAAIRAGYSEKTSYSIGQENLNKPEIQEAIQKAMDERSKRTEITADNVLKEIAKLGFANMDDYMTVTSDGLAYVDLTNLDRNQAAAITELTVERRKEYNSKEDDADTIEKVRFKLADKGINLERLGRHLKLFTDKVEQQQTITAHFTSDDVGVCE